MFEQLSSLKHEGNVEEYIKEFERLVAQVSRLPEAQFVGYFIHGLRDGIRGRVRNLKALGPVSRAKLMNLAHLWKRRYMRRGLVGMGLVIMGLKDQGQVLLIDLTLILELGRARNNDWFVVKGSNDGGEKGGNGSN